ncbi:hypothetical protein KR054_007643 [Drosophila jambulina]|nr:hypothetical protein KR054_007643 [Drosophila jambulina]
MAVRSLTLLLRLCLLSVLSLLGAEALEVPAHNCESYFSYYRRGNGEYFGLFTAPRAGISSFSWEVVFNAHGTGQAHTVSSLQPYPSKDQAFENIHNGERGQVFVDFQNFGNELPKLIRLELNDQLLCSNSEYDAPSSTMTRRQSMSTTSPIRQKSEPAATTYPVIQKSAPRTTPYPQSNPFLPQPGERPKPKPEVTPHVHESDYGECGQEGFAAQQIGGELVTRGQYPWMAALYEGGSTVTYKCVASVISKRTVITAAHCIYGKSASQLWVYLGRHDRFQNPEDNANLVSVSNVLTPPQYNGNPLPDADVGLLVLRQATEYTRYIQPLCMWSSGMSVPAREGDTGVVAGWGYDETGEKTQFPKAVSVQLVPRDTCLKRMKKAQDFITRRTVCAGNTQSHGPCFGDSGAALIVLRNNRWVIRGIVSISPSRGGSCDLSLYVIYSDVSMHLDWIQQNMVS